MDCLTQGWVLVNFPNNLMDFKEILEEFKMPPNKVLYLRCPQALCMQRLQNMPHLGQPYNNCTYFKREVRWKLLVSNN